MIRKYKGRYKVISHKGKRSFGTYRSKKSALKRLKQIKYFKYRGGK